MLGLSASVAPAIAHPEQRTFEFAKDYGADELCLYDEGWLAQQPLGPKPPAMLSQEPPRVQHHKGVIGEA